MRPRSSWLFAVLALLAVGVGCQSRPIPEPERIIIPDRLSQQAAEVAILSAVTAQQPPGIYDPSVEMAEQDFDLLVWNYYVASPGRAWVVESREPGRIVGVIERARHRLRVQVVYDRYAAKVSIVDSTGLGQEDGQIHRRAVAWVLKLEERLRTELDRMAAR
jgi:hypothetical protein